MNDAQLVLIVPQCAEVYIRKWSVSVYICPANHPRGVNPLFDDFDGFQALDFLCPQKFIY